MTDVATRAQPAGSGPLPRRPRQPYLHDHVTCVAAPTLFTSPADGELRGDQPSRVDGLYVADRRVLSRLSITLGDEPVAPVHAGLLTARTARFLGVARALGDPDSPDPTVVVERHRSALVDGGTETVVVRNDARVPARTTVTVLVAADLAPMGQVKSGEPGTPHPAEPCDGGLAWRDGPLEVRLRTSGPAAVDAAAGTLTWALELAPGESWTVELAVRATITGPDGGDGAAAPVSFRPAAPAAPAPWRDSVLTVRADDRRLDELVRQSVEDLDALLLSDPADPSDLYCAAGAPWYLTLFGRDSLWAARMSLVLGTELTAGTLRTLARRQGTREHRPSEEQPGKIAHELRPADAAVWLPPVYYGTVDATPLFVVTLAEAWRWGLPAEEVCALLPAVERALDWMADYGDPDGDGFLEYLSSGTGLVNQGWKDSADGVQFADGSSAAGPVALCEVQGYAYAAAISGAELLDAYGRPGGDRWREWAAALAERFRRAYWVSDADGAFPAIALDGRNRPVDSATSNMGHLLGTGLLSAEEEAQVARRLGSASMNSGHGLRTLADSARGFNPLSYHAGSVWTHDTAIVLYGLARGGHTAEAVGLLGGLLTAASHVGYRLPELYGGERANPPLPPVPYPASCRPQAWAAAAATHAVRALLGLEPDVPAGTVRLNPIAPSPVGAYEVRGIRIAGDELAVRVAADGTPTVLYAPAGLRVVGAG